MTLATLETWKRSWIALLVGLLVGVALVFRQSTLGKIAALILILPLAGGFWTAMRGIAFYTSAIIARLLRGGPRNLDKIRGRDKWDSAGYAAAASG